MLHRGMLQPRRLLPHLRPSDLHVVYEVSRRPPLTPIGLRPFHLCERVIYRVMHGPGP